MNTAIKSTFRSISSSTLLSVLFIILFSTLLTGVLHAQDATEEISAVSLPVYYIAADADGIDQVYQQKLGGQNEPRQITTAEEDVLTFGAAYDGLGIAYISAGRLWLQSVHTEEAEAVAEVTAERFFSSPVFSQDGNYLAYADNGVWLMDLSTRETEPILQDVPVAEDGSNMAEYRLYTPKQFVADPDGSITHLVVDAGVWEWNTDALYDLSTGDVQILGDEEPTQQFHTDILPLSDGRVLLYGNGGVGGEPNLHLADSLEDINTYAEVLDFSTISDATLFANQAVEIEPGIVRIFGPAADPRADVAALTVFWLDVNVNEGTASEVSLLTLTDGSETGSDIAGELSPDGSLLAVYEDAQFAEAGPIYGRLSVVELATGETSADTFPETVGIFHFQPHMPEALRQ